VAAYRRTPEERRERSVCEHSLIAKQEVKRGNTSQSVAPYLNLLISFI